jgi:uridylate kinase
MHRNASLPRFRRVVLKLSGEALVGEGAYGIDPGVLRGVAREIATAHGEGLEIGIVIGGGNIFRGLRAEAYGMPRVPADYMGMLATVMNALALAQALEAMGTSSKVLSAIDMPRVAEPYTRDRALRYLAEKRIVLFAAGTGNPYFTTDTAAALRAGEIGGDALLKATKVDGVYDADPVTSPAATRFDRLSYQQVLERGLKVMDLTAVSLAMELALPILVFDLKTSGNILKAMAGETVGTWITGESV